MVYCVVCGEETPNNTHSIESTIMPCSRVPLMFQLFETTALCETNGTTCGTCFEIITELDSAQVTVKHITGKLKSRMMNKKVYSKRYSSSLKERKSKKIKFEDEENILHQDLETASGMTPPLDVWDNTTSFLSVSSDNSMSDILSRIPENKMAGLFGSETRKPRRKRAVRPGKNKCKCDDALSYQMARKSTFDHDSLVNGVVKQLFGYESGTIGECCPELKSLNLWDRGTEPLKNRDKSLVISVVVDYLVKALRSLGFEGFSMLPSNHELLMVRTKMAEIFSEQEWAAYDGKTEARWPTQSVNENKDGFYSSMRERRRYLKDLEKRTCPECNPRGSEKPAHYNSTSFNECIGVILESKPHWEIQTNTLAKDIFLQMVHDFSTKNVLTRLNLVNRTKNISTGDWYKVCECFAKKASSLISKEDLPVNARDKKLYMELIPLLVRTSIAEHYPSWATLGSLGYGSIKFKDNKVVMNEKMLIDLMDIFKARMNAKNHRGASVSISKADSIIDTYLE